MSLAQITLTTNKTVSNVGDYVRKIGQDERGQVLPVIVVDATGTPYDLLTFTPSIESAYNLPRLSIPVKSFCDFSS